MQANPVYRAQHGMQRAFVAEFEASAYDSAFADFPARPNYSDWSAAWLGFADAEAAAQRIARAEAEWQASVRGRA